ncbi:MAG: transposase [bacterium]|nr:transposase [bacterium]
MAAALVPVLHQRQRITGAFIESFNGSFRDECLNEHWFPDLADARQLIESWRKKSNTSRPHSSLEQMTPEEFAEKQDGL